MSEWKEVEARDKYYRVRVGHPEGSSWAHLRFRGKFGLVGATVNVPVTRQSLRQLGEMLIAAADGIAEGPGPLSQLEVGP